MANQNLDPSLTERRFDSWIVRLREGDVSAKDEMLSFVLDRFNHIASRMLPKNLRSLNETGDLMSQALIRLNKTIQQVPFNSYDHFCAIVAKNLREALIDLDRRCKAQRRDVRRQKSIHGGDDDRGGRSPILDIEDDGTDPAEGVFLKEVHEAVERLGEPLRQICDLHLYAGLALEEVATVMGISGRQARRLYRQAQIEIDRLLQLQSSHIRRLREEKDGE